MFKTRTSKCLLLTLVELHCDMFLYPSWKQALTMPYVPCSTYSNTFKLPDIRMISQVFIRWIHLVTPLKLPKKADYKVCFTYIKFADHQFYDHPVNSHAFLSFQPFLSLCYTTFNHLHVVTLHMIIHPLLCPIFIMSGCL